MENRRLDVKHHRLRVPSGGELNKPTNGAQRREMLRQGISEFFVGFNTLITDIVAKFEQLRTIRPTKELEGYINRIKKEAPGLALPELNKPVTSYHRI